MGMSFVPVTTSVSTSIITRLTSVAPTQQPQQQPPTSIPTLAVPKKELPDPILPPWELVLAEQPIWAQKLLRRVYFEAIAHILDPISNKESLYVVSDGSAAAKQMTFGWIISTTKGQRLASSHGSCAGRPSSLLAKASGMLSSSLFITVLQTHYHCKFHPNTLGFMADNLKLVTRLNDHRQYSSPYPNTTLGEEFDLTKQIHLLYKEHKLPSYFWHVKVHQDRTT